MSDSCVRALVYVAIAFTVLGASGCTLGWIGDTTGDVAGGARVKNHSRVVPGPSRWLLSADSALVVLRPADRPARAYRAVIDGLRRVFPHTYLAHDPERPPPALTGYEIAVGWPVAPDRPVRTSGWQVKLLPIDEIPRPTAKRRLHVQVRHRQTGEVVRADRIIVSPWLYANSNEVDRAVERALADYAAHILRRG